MHSLSRDFLTLFFFFQAEDGIRGDLVTGAQTCALPILAFAMMHSITGQLHGEDYLQLAGPGFRDFTRIAAADAKVWRDILHANQEEVLSQLQHYRHALQAFEAALQANDTAALESMIEHASAARSQCFVAPKKD